MQERQRRERAGGRCILAAVLVVAADQLSKLAAVATLDGASVPLAGDAFLTLVYNDTFARGASLGAATLPATLLLAVAMLFLVARACAPLAAMDGAAPVALGLVAGATIGNAVDFLHTGRGAVDFLGWPTAEGAVVFNLADVAAYAGVALLARTTWRLAALVRAERSAAASLRREELATVLAPVSERVRATRTAARSARARGAEIALSVPLFVEPGVRERMAADGAEMPADLPPSREARSGGVVPGTIDFGPQVLAPVARDVEPPRPVRYARDE